MDECRLAWQGGRGRLSDCVWGLLVPCPKYLVKNLSDINGFEHSMQHHRKSKIT